jgi:hypothetical protein
VSGDGDPARTVARWFAEESGKDFPLIPQEWPEAYWAHLVERYPTMRYWVAHQPYAPESVIRTLARTQEWVVRGRVAMKRNLPADLFSVMAADPDPHVRCAIAANAKAPLDLVTLLTGDLDPEVASVAAYNRNRRLQKSAVRKDGSSQVSAPSVQPARAE